MGAQQDGISFRPLPPPAPIKLPIIATEQGGWLNTNSLILPKDACSTDQGGIAGMLCLVSFVRGSQHLLGSMLATWQEFGRKYAS
jgi:hypothetical protein